MFLTGSFVVAFAILFFQCAAAEEICFNGLVKISCSKDEHIYIESAIIGRLDNSKCYNRTKDEQECKANVRDQLQSQFLRTNNISFSTIDENFMKLQPKCLGDRPPSFSITHRCRTGSLKDALEFCENEKVTFGCLKEESLIIESAFLGRHNDSRCYCGNEKEKSCNVDIRMALKDRFGDNNSISFSMADTFIRGLASNCSSSLPYSLKVSSLCSKETVNINITHETEISDWKTIKTAILIIGHFFAFLLGAALSAIVIRCKGKAVKFDDVEMTNTTTSKSTAEEKDPAKPVSSVASADKTLPTIKVKSTDEKYSALCAANSPPDQSFYTKLEEKKDLPKIQSADEYSTHYGFRSPPAAHAYIEVIDYDSCSDAKAHED